MLYTINLFTFSSDIISPPLSLYLHHNNSDGNYFMNHVHISRHRSSSTDNNNKKPPRLGRVRLYGAGGGGGPMKEEREFYFDYAFGPKVGR